MKRLVLILALAIAVSSCAPGPVGAWKYSVTGTPQGDYAGTLNIEKSPTGYAAKMDGTGGVTPFNKFSFDKKKKITEGDFDFSGVNIVFSAKLNKDELKGTMSTSGMDFPFAATRKK